MRAHCKHTKQQQDRDLRWAPHSQLNIVLDANHLVRDTFSTKFSARLHELWCLYATPPGHSRPEEIDSSKGNAAERNLIQRYTGELNRQEDELASLRRTLADLQSKRDEAKNKLDAMLDKLTLDTKL